MGLKNSTKNDYYIEEGNSSKPLMHFTIVSYTFPPSKEIGGRRWAKFSQHIAKSGHTVTVVCSDNSGDQDWFKKEFPGVVVRCLPKFYPDWLSGIAISTIQKLLYLLFTRILTHFTKQNFFDKGFAWKKPMFKELESIHRENKIDVLVVTGAPFSLLYYGAQFKNHHKEIFYVSDFRDPWTWGSYYGIPKLNKLKKKFQEHSERTTVSESDLVCSPTDHMNNFLKSKYVEHDKKFYLLPHAYDSEKFPKQINQPIRAGFIYGGTLYDGIEDYVKVLAEVVNENPDSGFKWNIYTGTNYPMLNEYFTSHSVSKNSFVPEQELFQKIRESAAYLAIFPTTDKDLVSTKFFEIIYSETPILYIGEEGEVGKFVRENRIGVHILPENIKKELPQYLNGEVPFEKGYFDVARYSFPTVTQNFLDTVSGYKN